LTPPDSILSPLSTICCQHPVTAAVISAAGHFDRFAAATRIGTGWLKRSLSI
jgi:hypothetical protein